MVGAGIRQCAAGLTFGAGHGIRCGCGTRRKVSAAVRRRNHWGSSTSRLGLGLGCRCVLRVASSALHRVFHHQQRLRLIITSISSFSFLFSLEAKPLNWGQCLLTITSRSFLGNPDKTWEKGIHISLQLLCKKPSRKTAPCVQLRISCTWLSLCV